MHEENFLNGWLREDAESKAKEGKQMDTWTKEQSNTSVKRRVEEVKEWDSLGSKHACVNFSLSFCQSGSHSQDDNSVAGVFRGCEACGGGGFRGRVVFLCGLLASASLLALASVCQSPFFCRSLLSQCAGPGTHWQVVRPKR